MKQIEKSNPFRGFALRDCNWRGELLNLMTEAELSGDNGSEDGIMIFRKSGQK